MKELYLALCDQLKTIPEIKWVDLDSGQLDRQDTRAALKFPCALIRITFPSSEERGGGDQLANAQVQLRLAFDATGSRTAMDTPDTVKVRSLAYLDTGDKVYNLLQSYENDTFSSFEGQGPDQEQRSDGLVILRMTFNTSKERVKA